MNTFSFYKNSTFTNKDYYTQFQYPLGAVVVQFKEGATQAPKECRVEVLLNLMQHFVVAERKLKVKPTNQVYVESINKVEKTIQWYHERKSTRTDEVLDKMLNKTVGQMEDVVAEYEMTGNVPEELFIISCNFRDTVLNK
tara:strand:+ start:2545 stop:2964 length:420 start_codon:yes stop_codon:yes gene_type:complete